MADSFPLVVDLSPTQSVRPSCAELAARPDLCESVWTCMRGRTRLCCELQDCHDGGCQLTLLRNSRTYGKYEFAARSAALSFAARLRTTFEGNGWSHS